MGLQLSRQALRVLKERGIFVQSAVSLEHQHLAKRYVVRGLESGGAVGNLGRYVTFAQPDGWPIECLHPEGPRIGKAVRPAQEPIRLGQEPSLDFAPAVLSGVVAGGDHPAKVQVRFLGMLGPNGPLPLYLTDYARERLLHASDATFACFLDVFNHRFLK